MSVLNVATGGKGGPRTRHKDNSHPVIKVALRFWLLEHFSGPAVLDVYGGYGAMWRQVWARHAATYNASSGEALEWLRSRNVLDYDIFDVDPYSSPFEALAIISEKATKDKIGIICTDGCLKRQAMMRGRLPQLLQQACGWDWKNKALLAAIYYQYPKFLRFALSRVMPGWLVETLAVKYGKGWGKNATVYFAAVMLRCT